MQHQKINRNNPDDPLRTKTVQPAIRIIRLSRYLQDKKKEFTISKQLVRSGTHPGAMVREAGNAESGSDFIHKLGVAHKETGETQYWLELLFETDYLKEKEFLSIYADTEEIMRILKTLS